MTKIQMVTAIRDYAQNCLDSDYQEGTDILSALVNLVDTIAEGGLIVRGGQDFRTNQFVSFLLSHDNNNTYAG